MAYVLVKFEKDYADEFDICGMMACTTEEWEAFKKDALEKIEDQPDAEYYFGTNEYVSFEGAAEFDDAFDVMDITDDEYATLMRLFAGTWRMKPYFGFIPTFS